MKPLFRKLIAASLALVLAAAPLRASASEALGHDLFFTNTAVGERTELATGTFWSDSQSDLREENYIVYTPNRSVTPIVTYGSATTNLTTVPAMAAQLEAQGYRVVAGINGDYYDVGNGVPLGTVMANGVLQSALSVNYAIGFRSDGSAVLGKPDLSFRARVGSGASFDIAAFNYIRHSLYGIYLYDSNFNSRHSTATSEPGVDVICSVVSGRLSIGETLTLRVDEVLPEAIDTPVPEGKYVLTTNLKSGEKNSSALLSLTPGEVLSVTVSAADSRWNDVENMIGSLYQLVENGRVCDGLIAGSAPRTAVGQRADGSLIFYTIDGRQSGYSVGATLTQVAMRLVELGCVSALSLDGGGSTTLSVTMPDQLVSGVVNVPSEGHPRAVTNHIFLVSTAQPSGAADHIYLAPEATAAMPGAQIGVKATLIDSNYIPMSTPVTISSDRGSVTDNVLTLPGSPGVVTVTASAMGRSATATVEVVQTPDSVALYRSDKKISSLSLAPLDQVQLDARAIYRHLGIAANNSSFTWTLEGNIGTVDQNGLLTAADRAGSGTLRVSAGSASVSIPVTVSGKALRTLENFESSFPAIRSEDGSVVLSRSTQEAYLRRGFASARVDYNALGGYGARLNLNYPIAAGYDRINLWVYGDGSGTLLSLETDAGTAPVEAISFTGWRQLGAVIPAGATALTGLTFSAPDNRSGTIYLDQLVLSYGGIVDQAAPEVSLVLSGEGVSGRAIDAVDGTTLASLSVTYDGRTITHRYNAANGALSAALPASDGLSHRVSLTARDASGNVARASVTIPAAADAAPAFSDTKGHWANGAIDYLRRSGITNGNGEGKFQPDARISRQEFAVLLYRYLNPGSANSGDMPFVDAAQIASWASEAVRTMYAMGILKGSPDANGQLRFNPTATISRQEAVTMIGRLLEKGYAAPALSFRDSASIPDWSAEYISILSTLGILTGYTDGSFHPTDPMTRAQVATVLFKLR
ncbi:MAG: S-layer homology domain-containing protein [Oscillospiraceae bacterium]|nr:S-layer homology domain-containing protein [Oscillospiraceae bacterium]